MYQNHVIMPRTYAHKIKLKTQKQRRKNVDKKRLEARDTETDSTPNATLCRRRGRWSHPLHPQRGSNNDTLTIADSHTHSQHKVVHMATQEKGYINLLFVHYILKKQGGPSGY